VSGEAMLAVLQLSVAERLDVTFGRDIVRNVRTSSSVAEKAAEKSAEKTD
jgi:hypothetical protein